MALEPVGVEFIAANYFQFAKILLDAQQQIVGLGRITQNRLAVINQLGAQMTEAGRSAVAMADMVKKTTVAQDTATTSTTALTAAVATGIAIWDMAKGTIQKVTRALLDIAKTAEEAAEEFQTLTIRFDNLIARQVRAADKTVDYNESIQIASGYTKELQHWISELALTTPVSADDIQHITSWGLAFNWTIPQVKKLTQAIVDYTAGQGLVSDITERILFNFAQMRMAGKVTATELRDLARGAFFPMSEVLDIAAEKLGIAANGLIEFRKAAAEGAIDVETFFEAFTEWVNINLPNAAQNMNVTVKALRDNIQDLFKVMIGWNVFGPVVARAAEKMTKALAGLFTDENIRSTKLLGIALADAFEDLWASATKLAGALQSLFKAFGFGLPTMEEFVRDLTLVSIAINFWINRLTDGLNVISGVVGKAMNFIVGLFGVSREKMVGESYAMGRAVNSEFIKAGGSWGNTFADIAMNAFEWGASIIVNLAAGIVEGVGVSLIAVMNWVSGILEYWFAPGSPPLIAPDIDKWGAETMAEWLHGFTEVDFTILDAVQSPLRAILDTLVDLEAIGKEQMVAVFTDLSLGMTKALSDFEKTGILDPAILDQLRNIGGVWGKELEALFLRELDLAKGIKAAEEAQLALNRATEATKQARGNVHKLVKEYNALLRAGASPETLRMKLKEINAAEDQVALAQDQEKAAEAANQAAQDALDPLRDAAQIQEKLLAQMIELAKLQVELLEKKEEGGGAGGGEGAPEAPPAADIGMPELGLGGGLDTQLGNLFDNIKKSLLEKLGGIWDRLKEIWDERVGPVIEGVKAAWNRLLEIFVFITSPKGIDQFEINIKLRILELKAWLRDRWDEIVEKVETAWDNITIAIGLAINIAETIIKTKIAAIKKDWEEKWDAIKKKIEDIHLEMIEIVKTKLQEMYNWFFGPEGKITKILSELGLKVEDFKTAAGNLIGGMIAGVIQPLIDLYNLFFGADGKITAILTELGKLYEQGKSAGASIVQGMIDGIGSLAQALWNKITGVVSDAIKGAEKEIGKGSPAKVFVEIGQSMMQGLTLGIGKSALAPIQLSAAVSGASVRAARVQAMPTMASNSITFGDTNIYSGVEGAAFVEKVRRVVRDMRY